MQAGCPTSRRGTRAIPLGLKVMPPARLGSPYYGEEHMPCPLTRCHLLTAYKGSLTTVGEANTNITNLRADRRTLDDRELSTVFYLGYGPADSPYAYHILPMAEQMLPIRFAVAATASCHAANRLSSDHLRRQSLRLRVKATELLRQRLSGGSQAADLVSLASIMLLAQLDVSMPCCLYRFCL
jgi:hypothetical protein